MSAKTVDVAAAADAANTKNTAKSEKYAIAAIAVKTASIATPAKTPTAATAPNTPNTATPVNTTTVATPTPTNPTNTPNATAPAKSLEQVMAEQGKLLYSCVGSSMQPLIREGRDLVYITKRPSGRLQKYDVVLFRRPDTNAQGHGHYVLHRILKVQPSGTYWIVGDNCTSGDTVEESDFIGVLSAVKRDGKTITISDPAYRLYVSTWCAAYPARFLIPRCKALPRRAAGKALRSMRVGNKEKNAQRHQINAAKTISCIPAHRIDKKP